MVKWDVVKHLFKNDTIILEADGVEQLDFECKNNLTDEEKLTVWFENKMDVWPCIGPLLGSAMLKYNKIKIKLLNTICVSINMFQNVP